MISSSVQIADTKSCGNKEIDMFRDILSILWSVIVVLLEILYTIIVILFTFVAGLLKVLCAIPVAIVVTLVVLVGQEMFSDKFKN